MKDYTKRNQEIKVVKQTYQAWYKRASFVVLALYCYCGDKVKYVLLLKCFFQRNYQHCGWKKSQ